MMSEIDRITELLLSEQEMPDVYRSLMENASNTEPTLDPNSLEALIANQQDQLETRAQIAAMVLGPGKFLGPGKGAANLVKNLAAPYAKSSKNIQPVRKILRGGGDDFFIPPLTQTGRRITRNPYPSPRPNPVSQPIYKQLGISDKAMNIMAGGIAGLSAYTTAGLIYDRLDEETKTQLKKLLQISTEPTE